MRPKRTTFGARNGRLSGASRRFTAHRPVPVLVKGRCHDYPKYLAIYQVSHAPQGSTIILESDSATEKVEACVKFGGTGSA